MKKTAQNLAMVLGLSGAVSCSGEAPLVDQINNTDNTKTIDNEQSDAGNKVHTVMEDAGNKGKRIEEKEPTEPQTEPEPVSVVFADSGASDAEEDDPEIQNENEDAGIPSEIPTPVTQPDASAVHEPDPLPLPMNDAGVEEQQYLTRAEFAKSFVGEVLQLDSEEECESTYQDINEERDAELCNAVNVLRERGAMPGVEQREIMQGEDWQPHETVSVFTTWAASVSALGFPVYEAECGQDSQWINNDFPITEMYISALCDKGFALEGSPTDIYANQTQEGWNMLKIQLAEYLDERSNYSDVVETASAIIRSNWYLDDLECISPAIDVEDNSITCITINDIEPFIVPGGLVWSDGTFNGPAFPNFAVISKIFVLSDGRGNPSWEPEEKCFQEDENQWYFGYGDQLCQWDISPITEYPEEISMADTPSRRTLINMAFDIKNRPTEYREPIE